MKAGITGVAAVAAGPVVAQEPKPDVDISVIEKQLAKPLSDQAKKLLKASVRNSQNASAERLKFKLPENSEPGTLYVASTVVVGR